MEMFARQQQQYTERGRGGWRVALEKWCTRVGESAWRDVQGCPTLKQLERNGMRADVKSPWVSQENCLLLYLCYKFYWLQSCKRIVRPFWWSICLTNYFFFFFLHKWLILLLFFLLLLFVVIQFFYSLLILFYFFKSYTLCLFLQPK